MGFKTSFSVLLLSFVLIFMVQNATGQQESLGTFQGGENITLIQLCGTCTYSNISSVTDPSSEVLVSEVAMTKSGTQFSYVLGGGNTTGNYGRYNVNGYGDKDGVTTPFAYFFTITPNGEAPTTAKAFLYIGLLALLVFFLVLIFWAHLQDQSHLARFWWFSFMWIPIWAILFIGWSMSRDFLTSGGAITSIFWWAFLVVGVVYPFFILGLVLYTFYFIYKQKEVQKLLKRGFSLEDAQGRVGGRGRGMMN